MMSRKVIIVGLIAVFSLLLAATPLMAAKPNPKLEKLAQTFLKVMGSDEGLALMKNVSILKKAGLSYQQELVVPTSGVIDCKSKEQVRVLMGMYTFDTNYAAVFGKKKEFLASRKVMTEDIVEKLDLPALRKLRAMAPAKLKKVAEDPGQPANREALLANWRDQMNKQMALAAKDPELMDVYVDALHGSIVEGLYVSCKLALSSGVGDAMIALFNYNALRLTSLQKVLKSIADDKELSAMVEHGERDKLLDPVLKILKDKKGKLTKKDVGKILALVEPVRAPLVKKCK
jgi:hypothetical protein